jgi:hypothetical protein
VLGVEGLGARDRGLARAVAAESRGDYGAACPIWRTLTEQQPRDFTTWYGLASCLRRDDAVLPDPASPSGYRFRTSYRAALAAYQRAFRLHSPVLASFGDSAFVSMRRLLKTSPNALRPGRALPPDSGVFAAYPGWEGDSLSLVPWPLRDVSDLSASRPHEMASRHQREAFHDIALAWATEAPRSSAALEALGLSLEMLGQPSALDTLRAARRLAGTVPDRIRLATEEVWLRLKLAFPDHPDGLQTARDVADTVLSLAPRSSAESVGYLASLASLTGQAALAASLSRREGIAGRTSAPPYLATTGPPFLAFAALGGPIDSLETLERAVAAAIGRDRDPARAAAARREWLLRPVSLAFPDWMPDDLTEFHGNNDHVIDMQVAWSRGDSNAVRAALDRLPAMQAEYTAATLSADGLYPEVRMLLELGDSAGARARLTEYLGSLGDAPPGAFMDVARAGALVRAMAMAASLASHVGEQEIARSWAAAVLTLWNAPDDFLVPTVNRMRRVVEDTHPGAGRR